MFKKSQRKVYPVLKMVLLSYGENFKYLGLFVFELCKVEQLVGQGSTCSLFQVSTVIHFRVTQKIKLTFSKIDFT